MPALALTLGEGGGCVVVVVVLLASCVVSGLWVAMGGGVGLGLGAVLY
jgi:hypothetical protein